MTYINYNFENFNKAMSHLKNGQTQRAVNELKNELNKFFKDSECEQVIFTKNTDKLFFGMTTYCQLGTYDVVEVIGGSEPIRIRRYSIEIDSKLLELGLTSRELTAILLHEVGHVVNDSTPIEEVRKAVDKYMAEYNTTIDINNSEDLLYLFRFAVQDSIRKTKSLFTRNDEEILADEFVFRCGYGEDLERAFRKIRGSALTINKNVSNKLITLQWAFQIYKNIGIHRLGAIKTLNKAKGLTGSELEKKELDIVINGLNNKKNVTESSIELIRETSKNSLPEKLRRKGLRSIEEDIYEYQMRICNVESEDEAIVLMRQINSRMSILDDYIYNSQNVDKKELERWEKVYDKYELLRQELSKKTIYNNKSYGLWLDYNYATNFPGATDAYLR